MNVCMQLSKANHCLSILLTLKHRILGDRSEYMEGGVGNVENGHSYRKELSRSLKNNLEFCRKT